MNDIGQITITLKKEMMKMLYPLNEQIERILIDAYDPATGELLEGITEESLAEQIQKATSDREELLDSLASEIKNSRAEAEMVKAEKNNLANRQRVAANRADRASRLMAYLLQGEKWENQRHKISYRKTEVVEVDEDFVEWALTNAPGLIKSEPEPRKFEIKQAIKAGAYFEHAHLETRNSLQVK